MKKILSVLLFISSAAFAQSAASPTDKFAWNIDAQSLAVAQSYAYEVELDGVVLPTALVTTCSGATAPYDCAAPIPAVTPSTHTARVRAVDASGTPLMGPFSDMLTFTMRAVPAKPGNLRIVPGGGAAGDNYELGNVPTPEQ